MKKLKDCKQTFKIKKVLHDLIVVLMDQTLQKEEIHQGERSRFLILAGPNGQGKTYLAKCAYDYINPYLSGKGHYDEIAIMTTISDLYAEWKTTMKTYGEVDELTDKYKKTKLLVLDDLGIRTPTDAFHDFLMAIINFRKENPLNQFMVTIITTNMSPELMMQKFGGAIYSRIASDEVFKLDHGVDRRFKELK